MVQGDGGGPRLTWRRWREESRLWRLAQVGTGADRRQEEGLPEDPLPVRVHPILGPGLTFQVLERQAGEPQAPSVRQDQPRPRDEQASLARCDLVVVGAEEPRALGD